jgi:hypothetical protein
MGIQSIHHPQVKVLVHNTGFVPSGVCQTAEMAPDSSVLKPVTLAIPVERTLVSTEMSAIPKSEHLPHLVPIAPKGSAPIAIAPRPSAVVTNVTTVLTQPQPTSAVQVVKPPSKKPSSKAAKANNSQPPQKTEAAAPVPPPPASSSSNASSEQVSVSYRRQHPLPTPCE